MRLVHIIAFTWRPGTTHEQIDRFDTALREYVATAEGVEMFTCGQNIGPVDDNADYGIVAVFRSWQAFEDYRQHPDHVALVQNTLVDLVQSRTVIQIDAEGQLVANSEEY